MSLVVLAAGFFSLEISLSRIWFLVEEETYGPIKSITWINHQILFESIWALNAILGMALLFGAPIWLYTSLQLFSKIEEIRAPFYHFTYIIPVLNWNLLYYSFYHMVTHLKPNLNSQRLLNKRGFIGVQGLPTIAVIHLLVWTYPYQNLLEYKFQAYALCCLGLIQIFSSIWVYRWIGNQKIINSKLLEVHS